MEGLRPDNTVIPDNFRSVIEEATVIENIPPSHSKEFKVSDMKDEPGKFKLDFFGGDNPNSFIKTPTASAQPEVGTNPNYINPNSTNQINNPLNPLKSKEEIRGSMSVLIAILDYALAVLGQFIAGEGTHAAYTADTPQKKLLENALTDYFYEKQIKISSGLALVLAFGSCYGFMIVKAFRIRIEKKKGNKINTIKKEIIPTPFYKGPLTEKEIEKIKGEPAPVIAPEVYQDIKTNGKFGWLIPDKNITAKNRTDLDVYISKNIYPMFLKNVNNNKVRKIKYDTVSGKPILIGKPPRVK